MGLIKEFKEFAVKGNVMDMAVGVIIGGAFGKIVTSLVNDIIMPPIGKILGNLNFKDLFVSLDPEKTANITSLVKAQEAGAAVLAYGSFINTVLDFLLVGFSIFVVIKIINRLKRKEEEAPPPPNSKECPHCLLVIPIKASRCGHCTSNL